MLAIEMIVWWLYHQRRTAEIGPELRIEEASMTARKLYRGMHISHNTIRGKATELVQRNVAQRVDAPGPAHHWRLTEEFVKTVKAAADVAVVKILAAGGEEVHVDRLREAIQARGYDIDFDTMVGVVAELVWRTTALPIMGTHAHHRFRLDTSKWLEAGAEEPAKEEAKP